MECTSLLEMLQFQFSTITNTTISVIVDNNGIITDGDMITALINLNLITQLISRYLIIISRQY